MLMNSDPLIEIELNNQLTARFLERTQASAITKSRKDNYDILASQYDYHFSLFKISCFGKTTTKEVTNGK